jgi:hypothetical protein
MMGRETAGEIRAELRKAYKMSDAKLRAWFSRRIANAEQKTPREPTEIDTLELIRDALLKEVKRSPTRRAKRKVVGANKK